MSVWDRAVEKITMWADTEILWVRRLSIQQLQLICQQLSFALDSGMPLTAALLLIGTEMRQPLCKKFLLELAEWVRQGRTFTQALQQSKIRYSPVLLEFVLAGEENGALRETIGQAAIYFQQQNKTKQMLFSALFYPAVLLLLMIFALGAMFFLVVPTVVQTYENFDAQLPVLTQWFIESSEWLRDNWSLLLAVIVLSAVLFLWQLQRWGKHPKVRVVLKKGLLKLPVVGKLYQQYWFVQIAQALGMMLSGGMLLLQSLRAVQQIYGRSLFIEEVEQLAENVAQGYSLSMGMQRCTFIPQMACQMLTVSEHSGALPQGLLQLSQYYRQQFQQRLTAMIGLLEPCFVIFLGALVLLLTSSLFLPLLQSYQYLL